MPTKISYGTFPLSMEIPVPNMRMMMKSIRGRFRVVRYVLILLKFNNNMITKKSNRIASLPSAGNCGYAHHSTPYPMIVTKRW